MRYFILILLSTALFSCSSLKKTTNKKTSEVEANNAASTTHDVELNEQADTAVTLPADTTEVYFNSTDTTEQRVETPNLIIKTKVKNGKIKTKVIQKKRTVALKINRNLKEKKATRITENSKQKTSDYNREKEKTGLQLPWYIWLLTALVVAVLLWRLKVKYF